MQKQHLPVTRIVWHEIKQECKNAEVAKEKVKQKEHLLAFQIAEEECNAAVAVANENAWHHQKITCFELAL